MLSHFPSSVESRKSIIEDRKISSKPFTDTVEVAEGIVRV
jgi:hypothetical protein